jgi:ferredoxin
MLTSRSSSSPQRRGGAEETRRKANFCRWSSCRPRRTGIIANQFVIGYSESFGFLSFALLCASAPLRLKVTFDDETNLAEFIRSTPEGQEADSILRACVHCGFCTATCPTYQLLGDELDSPRGRIYLMKEVLEGNAVTAKTQMHLDRCLTCRACETTCPSGVQYGRLVDIGRNIVDQHVSRPLSQSIVRTALRIVLPRPALFKPLLRIGQAVRPLLPAALKKKIPKPGAKATPNGRRRVMRAGCWCSMAVCSLRLRRTSIPRRRACWIAWASR